MSAGVVECPQAIVRSRHDDALRSNLGGYVVTRASQTGFMPNAHPVLVPDRLKFAPIVSLVEIPMARNSVFRLTQAWHVSFPGS